MTLIQRFGSALSLSIHPHMLFLDGVYVRAAVGKGEAAKPVFQHVAAPSSAALQALVQRVAERIGSALRKSFALQTLPPRPQREHDAYVAAARGHLGGHRPHRRAAGLCGCIGAGGANDAQVEAFQSIELAIPSVACLYG